MSTASRRGIKVLPQHRVELDRYILTHGGRSLSIRRWALELNVDPYTLLRRVRYGWDAARILESPAQELVLSAAEALDRDPADWEPAARDALPELLAAWRAHRGRGG